MTPYQRELRRLIEAEMDQTVQVAALLAIGTPPEAIRRELGLSNASFALHKHRLALVLGPQRVEHPEPIWESEPVPTPEPEPKPKPEPERKQPRRSRVDLRLPPGMTMTPIDP